MPTYRSIIGNRNDRAVVISLPTRFNLKGALAHADEILLATAFAKMTGWKHLKSSIVESKGHVRLLAGLDFMQTDPDLLKEWLLLANQNSRIEASLASRDATFHPKVLIVRAGSPHTSFAIVGSGNLTDGGFRTNTECALYTADRATLSILRGWFYQCWVHGTKLTNAAIKEYSPKFKKAKKAREQLRAEQKRVLNTIVKAAVAREAKEKAVLKEINKAIAAFKQYRNTPKFQKDYSNRLNAANSIRKLLHIPTFDFTRQEFNDFYSIGYLGTLRVGWRDVIFKQQKRLRKALTVLVDERLPIEERVDSVLEGSNGIRGLAKGGVSKILIAADPNKWPVLNGPVETTLKFFGYDAPRGSSPGRKYKVFVELLNEFKAKTGAPDFIALDSFFKFWEQKQQNKKKKKIG